ncbi:MAG: hypothetical protein LBL52_01240 [Rickettsiales bacterium]|jgi:hypothetical protein|nr:hypothetical protein [Rickettsiales bacterium]
MRKVTLIAVLLYASPVFALDFYSVAKVKAEARAASGSEAKALALEAAGASAMKTVVRRLLPSADAKKLLASGGYDPAKLIRGYKIAEEKTSPSSYSALIDVSFEKSAVNGFIESRGFTPSDTEPEPVKINGPLEKQYAVMEAAENDPANIVKFTSTGEGRDIEILPHETPEAAVIRMNDIAKSWLALQEDGGVVQVLVRLSGLDDWVGKERRLAKVGGIKEMHLSALKYDRAQLSIRPATDASALLLALSKAGFIAESRGGYIIVK